MEGLDPVLQSPSLPWGSLSTQLLISVLRLCRVCGERFPGGRVNTAPVISMVFPGTENRLIYLTLPQPLESSDPLSAAPETALQHCTNKVIICSSTGVSPLIWLKRATHTIANRVPQSYGSFSQGGEEQEEARPMQHKALE